MKIPPFLRLPLVVLLATFFNNCAVGTKNRPPDLSQVSPQLIQAKVARNFSKLRSFEGKARVIIELPGEGYQGSSKIFINFPDSVFIKTEAILGIDIGALFIDARIFGAYAPRENILYYGEARTLDLRDFLQVEIATDALISVLTGLPQIPHDATTALALAWDDNSYLLSVKHKNGMEKYWIDPKKYIVVKTELLDDNGALVMTGEYKRAKTKNGIVLPQTIRITRPAARERFTVYYTSQKLNKTIPSPQFQLKTANNAKRVYWGDVIKRANESTPQK